MFPAIPSRGDIQPIQVLALCRATGLGLAFCLVPDAFWFLNVGLVWSGRISIRLDRSEIVWNHKWILVVYLAVLQVYRLHVSQVVVACCLVPMFDDVPVHSVQNRGNTVVKWC